MVPPPSPPPAAARPDSAPEAPLAHQLALLALPDRPGSRAGEAAHPAEKLVAHITRARVQQLRRLSLMHRAAEAQEQQREEQQRQAAVLQQKQAELEALRRRQAALNAERAAAAEVRRVVAGA